MPSEDTGRNLTHAMRCDIAAELTPREARLYWRMCRYQDIRDGAMADRDWQTAFRAHERAAALEQVLAGVLDAQ